MTVEPEPVVRRPRSTSAPSKGRSAKRRPGRTATGGGSGGNSSTGNGPRGTSSTVKQPKARSSKSAAPKSKSKPKPKPKPKAPEAKGKTSRGASSTPSGLGGYLLRPSTAGPKVRLGILWFIVAVGSVVIGRWTVMALWAAVAATAAWQVSTVWARSDRAFNLPSWTPHLSAGGAVLLCAAAGVGTSLAGIALIVVPVLVVGTVMVSGRKPAAAGAAVIGMVLASIPAVAVILIARSETWAAMFLVVAVSFYDAGYFIGAAESSSRLEGPVTGAIGLLAVTFAASAFETAPFDRATAWVAGVMILLACPLGQMLTVAELPGPDSQVPAMKRLDTYLIAAPLMLGAVWAMG